MNKNLLKTFLVAVGLAAGVNGAWAQEVTETYDFLTATSTASGNVNVEITGEAIQQEGTFNAQSVYLMVDPVFNGQTMYLNGRFAVNYDSRSNTQMRWLFRYNSGNSYQRGLTGNWNGNGEAVSSYNLSILNLYGGDRITITYAIRSGRDASPKVVKDGVLQADGEETLAAGTALESGTTYEVIADGTDPVNVDLAVINDNLGIHSVTIVSSHVDESITPATISVTGVNGGDRTITISANRTNLDANTVTYYTLNGEDPTVNSTRYEGPFTVTAEDATDGIVTVKAITVKEGDNSVQSAIATFELEGVGSTIKLATPAWEKVSVADGVSIVRLISSQDGILGTPIAQIHYGLSNGQSGEVASGTEINVPDGETLTIYAVATGYENSDAVTVTAQNVVGTTVWSETYNGIVSENVGITLGSEVAANINSSDYYNIYNGETKISEYLVAIPTSDDYYLFRSGGIYGGRTHSYAIDDLKAGQYLVFTGTPASNGTFVINDPSNLVADAWNTIANDTYTFRVEADGPVTFTVPRYCYIETLTLIDPITTITKTVPDFGYVTFSASVPVTVPEGVTVYKGAVNDEASAITITEVNTDVIPANTGVLLGAAAGEIVLTQTENAGNEDDFDGNEFQPTSLITAIPEDGNYYVLSQSKGEVVFAHVVNGMRVSPDKAYIRVSETAEPSAMRIMIDGSTTGISEIDSAETAGDGAYYTLQGVKVENPTKGLYIHNGKKVIIK